ncbi:hypothetical protein BMF94_2813 [Rhodotorula taiwanensis]|uniref:NADH dehydrogenase [ubiquinone] 1 beta subcomplex subunit 4 n=1 Tax=Rhodotorula taiwanensis TaxID=741276 RepID=A0A2S5BB43_9BASI|nr:hypothetical protein BMF94_2813 [Rhodotorula taiwanensis]
MAGGHGGYQPVKLDPGVEAWSYARENVWRFFRFTQRTSRQSLVWGALLPIGVFAICQQQDRRNRLSTGLNLPSLTGYANVQLKWEVTSAQRDDPIARWGDFAKRPSERAAAAAPAEDDE